jgi:hypothetical protein
LQICWFSIDHATTRPREHAITPIRAVQVIMQYLYELAAQHGEVMELQGKLGDLIGRSESGVAPIV